MTSEQQFLFFIMGIVVAVALVSKTHLWIKRAALRRLRIRPTNLQRDPHEPEHPFSEDDSQLLSAEESMAELERLQELIEDRKQIAKDTDISHHLWGFYKSLLRYAHQDSSHHYNQVGEWYDVKILKASKDNLLSKIEFELKGARYQFVDDEEKQGWRENTKLFSLYLYDDSDRCLIEIPMKMNVDSEGRRYSVLTGGPRAFLTGGWVNEFIYVKLKHQRIRNQEIRAQKHQERLSEIEDLKTRFGIPD